MQKKMPFGRERARQLASPALFLYLKADFPIRIAARRQSRQHLYYPRIFRRILKSPRQLQFSKFPRSGILAMVGDTNGHC
jgi:hypothetical protein